MANKYLEKIAGIPDYLGPLGGPVERFMEGPANRIAEHLINHGRGYATHAAAGTGGYLLGKARAKAEVEKKANIDINPANKGLLHKKMGIGQGKHISTSALEAEKAKAKKSGNTKLEREVVFAENAKHFHHR